MAAQRQQRGGLRKARRSGEFLVLILLITGRAMCDDGLWIVPLDMSTSNPGTESGGSPDPGDPEFNTRVASPTETYETDPVFSVDDLECTIENSRVWTDCGSCQCCYKRQETRANCFGNITDIPLDLPENITHLTLRETKIEKISAMNKFDLKISKFSIYTELIQLELKDNELLAEIEVGAFDFDPLIIQKSSLKNIFIDGSPNLKDIADGAFGYFHCLSDIKIVYCGLTSPPLWKRDAFTGSHLNGHTHTVYMMDLSHNKIAQIPEDTFIVAQEVKIGTIDLSYNRITHLKRRAISGTLEIGTLKLRHNPLKSIEGFAFNGSRINNLLLSDNRLLTRLDQHTFSNTNLEHLDLSRTSITGLPTDGLQTLKNLTIQGTYSLQSFPSVFKMEQIKGAKLTYPHHCCAFHHPEKQNKTAYEIFKREMDAECLTTTAHVLSPTELTKILHTTTATTKTAHEFDDFRAVQSLPRGTKSIMLSVRNTQRRQRRSAYGLDKAFGSFAHSDSANLSTLRRKIGQIRDDAEFGDGFETVDDDADELSDLIFAGDAPAFFDAGFDSGNFHTSTLDPKETYLSTKKCGELVEHIKLVPCTPIPDAFNPCEDVLGFTWLRVIAWFVVITAEFGNISVIVVTLCSKYKLTGLTVSKFLICNLAFADLTLGTYLMVLAAFDLSSKGHYFTHAIIWQYEGGCQLAGFLATFSTCLSTFTLTVITLERWYTIRYAMNPDKRLRLRHAAIIMTCGWTFALVMATLPLLGVSNFSKTSICLPMETSSPLDEGYTITLMLGNAGCFVVICVCYTDMYCKVRANNTTSAVGRSDANIAKRMASLVFTDFVCLFPIVFFGLTAAAGKPLIDVTDSKILLVIFFPLNACANPFLYVIATKHFRKDFISMLSRFGFCERKASEYRLAMTSNPMSMSHSRNSLSGVTQNLIHRPSAGSTLTTTTCLYDHQKASKGSPSIVNNTSQLAAREEPNKASPSATPEATANRDTDSRKLSVVLENNLPSGETGRGEWEPRELRGRSLVENSKRQSGDVKPPCKTVRSISEYSAHSLPRREHLSGENGDGDGFDADGSFVRKGSEATDVSDRSVGLDRCRTRLAKHSIPGDSGFGEEDVTADVIEGSTESQNAGHVLHSSSTDTSICPLSDRTSSSNGGVDELTLTTNRTTPVERSPCSQTKPFSPCSSVFCNQDDLGQKEQMVCPEQGHSRLMTAGPGTQTYGVVSGLSEGYTNTTYTSEEPHQYNTTFS